jgi:hypothetical protein
MAWASRSDRDGRALKAYVDTYSNVLSTWQSVPGLSIPIDKTRVDAAQEKRDRQVNEDLAEG